MKYFFDTEFIDTGREIHLISIGMVDELGREFYAEVDDYPQEKLSPWLKENVCPHLSGPVLRRHDLGEQLVSFIGAGTPEFFAWFGSYDFVCLSQIYGPLMQKPRGWPHRFTEIAQLPGLTRQTRLPEKPKNAHNALADAKWNLEVYRLWENGGCK